MDNKMILTLSALAVLNEADNHGLSDWAWMKRTQIQSGVILSTAEKNNLMNSLLDRKFVLSYRESLTDSLRYIISDTGRLAVENAQ